MSKPDWVALLLKSSKVEVVFRTDVEKLLRAERARGRRAPGPDIVTRLEETGDVRYSGLVPVVKEAR